MQSVTECYSKVKKDCFRYIASQETRTEKFKNKDKMIKSFLIPVSFYIANRANKEKTMIVGLAGGQGTGKTTISSIIKMILEKYFKFNVFKISIDDFYKTRKDRLKLSKNIHPLLMTRGVPGTHDIKLIVDFFKKVLKRKFSPISLPKFDKSIDDRVRRQNWYKIKKKPNIVILEGWCVGSSAQKLKNLRKPINSLEKNMDQKLKWRKYVNNQLNSQYKTMHKMLDSFLYLKAKDFSLLRRWRLKQEKKLSLKNKNKKNSKIMSKNEVLNFMMTYQRITEHMFKEVPKFASMVLTLNQNHQIKNIKYKK
ncbi:MAG: uridine kinase [Candidatus Pelagibacter sp.]|tara:strand:+ start:515 stop:1441 length:927 start_codon:yes stop_codon:yes gene_type:complete